VWGFGLVDLRSNGFNKTDETGQQSGTFGLSNTALLISNGFPLIDRWSVGATFKTIREEIDTQSAYAYGADLGVLGRLTPRLQAGFIFRNAWAPQLDIGASTERFPRETGAGLNYQPIPKLILAFDLARASGQSVKVQVGSDWKINSILSLRAGVNETELAAGLGFQFGTWSLDYAFGYDAFAANIDDLGGTHKLGFHVQFGSEVPSKPNTIASAQNGRSYIETLSAYMDAGGTIPPHKLNALEKDTRRWIDHQGFEPKDLYRVEAYLCYFKGDAARSELLLSKSHDLDPKNEVLTQQLNKLRSELADNGRTAVETASLENAKKLYAEGDAEGAEEICRRILSTNPHLDQAATLLNRIRKETIEAEMKSAKENYSKAAYIEAFIHLRKVLEIDPQNSEATEYTVKTLTLLEKQSSTEGEKGRNAYEINDNVAKSMGLYRNGVALLSRGKVQEAVKLFEEALKYAGGNYLAREAMNKALDDLQDRAVKNGSSGSQF